MPVAPITDSLPPLDPLTPGELREFARWIASSLKSPDVGDALASVGAGDPVPESGKRKRVREALIATVERDGHCRTLDALAERIRAYNLRELARLEANDAAYWRQDGVSEPGTVSTIGDLTVRIGISYAGGKENRRVALQLHDSHESTEAELDSGVAYELIRLLVAARREVATPCPER